MDPAWAFWTMTAEETLLVLSCLGIAPDSLPAEAALPLAPPHLPRGRGTDQLLCEVCLCPKQRRDTGGPLTCPVVRIQAAHGPLRDVLRLRERPAHGVGTSRAGCSRRGQRSGAASKNSAHSARSMPAGKRAAHMTGWPRWSRCAASL